VRARCLEIDRNRVTVHGTVTPRAGRAALVAEEQQRSPPVGGGADPEHADWTPLAAATVLTLSNDLDGNLTTVVGWAHDRPRWEGVVPFVPNTPRRELPLRGVPEDLVAWPFVDELFDYTAFLNAGPIANVPQAQWGAPVAVIGAGAAGMCAAFELLKTGLTPVVFEASDRIGGRNWSQYFIQNGRPTNVFAEMGAMRVPTQNQVFYKYAGDFKLSFGTFPDPGTVQTRIYYENQIYDWAPGTNPPGPFLAIRTRSTRLRSRCSTRSTRCGRTSSRSGSSTSTSTRTRASTRRSWPASQAGPPRT